MNPSGLMIRSGRMRIILGGAFIFLGCLLLFLTHQTFKLQGVEKESHNCMQQKDSVVAQLQVCTEYKKRLDSALDKEKTNFKECLDGQATLKNEHKLDQEKDEDRYKKLMLEFEELKKEKKTIEAELTSQQELLAHSKEEIKKLQGELDTCLKENQQLEEAHEAEAQKAKQNKEDAENCQRRVKEIYASLTTPASTTISPEPHQPAEGSKQLEEEKDESKPINGEEQETLAPLNKSAQGKPELTGNEHQEMPISTTNTSTAQDASKVTSLEARPEIADGDKESSTVAPLPKEPSEQSLGEPRENLNASLTFNSPAEPLPQNSVEVKDEQQEDQDVTQKQEGPDGAQLNLSNNLTESGIGVEPILNPSHAPGHGVFGVGNLAGLDGLDGAAEQGYADQEDVQLGEEESPIENLKNKPRMLSQ